MQLFHLPDLTKHQPSAAFNATESQHIVKVLRKKTGDEIQVTNGVGDLFICQITQASHKACQIVVIEHQYHPKPHDYYLHLLVAPTKSNDRFEWFLEKATEIGIDEITPILTENAERKSIKIARYQKIMLSAMKQSLQFHLPKLNQMSMFHEVVKLQSTHKYLAHCDTEFERAPLFKQITPKSKYLLCIGPEGDFNKKEIQQAYDNGFMGVSLGNNRLRTETAAITACHSVSIKNSFYEI